MGTSRRNAAQCGSSLVTVLDRYGWWEWVMVGYLVNLTAEQCISKRNLVKDSLGKNVSVRLVSVRIILVSASDSSYDFIKCLL